MSTQPDAQDFPGLTSYRPLRDFIRAEESRLRRQGLALVEIEDAIIADVERRGGLLVKLAARRGISVILGEIARGYRDTPPLKFESEPPATDASTKLAPALAREEEERRRRHAERVARGHRHGGAFSLGAPKREGILESFPVGDGRLGDMNGEMLNRQIAIYERMVAGNQKRLDFFRALRALYGKRCKDGTKPLREVVTEEETARLKGKHDGSDE